MEVRELTAGRPSALPRLADRLEAFSKGAAIVSVLLIVLLDLGLNRDITWMLRALAAAALIVGWSLPAVAPTYAAAVWLFVAPVAPAIVGRLAHREGPVVDLVWMAGLAATLIRTGNWTRWELPAGWRPLIGGWALVLSLAWPVIAAREIGFDPRLVSDTGAVNSWGMVTAPQAFAWVLYVALTQLLGALWLDAVVARIASDARELGRTVAAFCAGATLASIVAILQGLHNLNFLSTPAWASLHRATGTMMDANGFGVAAAIAAPLVFLALRGFRRATLVAGLLLGVNVAGMWVSGSRTALLCALGGLAGLMIAVVLRHGGRHRRALPAALAVTVLAAVIVVSASSAVGPLRRLRELPQSTRSAIASLWTRGGYGTVAVQMAREYPLTGVGLGTYHVIVADYWHRFTDDDGLPFDNAQNWWRHEAAEFGILGGLAIVAWSLLAAWILLFRPAAPERRFTAITLRGVIVGIAACSMVGMPTQNPLVLLVFFLVVGWLASTLSSADLPAVHRHAPAVWLLLTVLAVSYAAAHVYLGHRSLSPRARAIRSGREYVVGAYPPERIPAGNEFRWTRQAARFVWPARAGVLVVRLWAREPDIERRPVDVQVSTGCGILFEGALNSTEPLDIAIRVPGTEQAVAATVNVSRTWRPADVNGTSNDRRSLGVAVLTDWLGPGEAIDVPVRPLPACGSAS